ncbi:hypothetical protein ACFC4G_42320 [Streptomyces sp. NPDC056002]|uniref:hypothetical protein n=1 Tax=Streptomyces sp. NPDC056002 TaxID=3345675 RepID=UPI0035D6929F
MVVAAKQLCFASVQGLAATEPAYIHPRSQDLCEAACAVQAPMIADPRMSDCDVLGRPPLSLG